jgi:flagellar biosynthesis chaperone FliJ
MGGLVGGFSNLAASLNFAKTAAAEAVPIIDNLADKTKKLADAEKQLAGDMQFAKEQTEGHARAMKDVADAGPAMTVAFFSPLKALLEMAPATKEATAALVDLLKAQNLYTDSLQKTLSIAGAWNDYLANLKQSYDDGVTSILQYKLALEAFLHTLQTQFTTATGKAKAALEEMIAAVQKLINTAGGTPQNTDYSAGGALNKAFNKP